MKNNEEALDRMTKIIERYDAQQDKIIDIIKQNVDTIEILLKSANMLTDKVKKLEDAVFNCNCKKK